jgi:primary-amine oxidase
MMEAPDSDIPDAMQGMSRHHPLGPLTADEITQAANLVRASWPKETDCHFKVVTLLEPPKAKLISYLASERAGHSPATINRRAFVVYYLRGTVRTAPVAAPSWYLR